MTDAPTNTGSSKDSAEEPKPDASSMKRTNIRWCLLAMACFYMLGNNFCYDNPGPLETSL